MPYYKVIYKVRSNPDHRMCPLGLAPNREAALDQFNANARTDVGRFKFDSTFPSTTYYHLVEQPWFNGPQGMYPIYKG
jgi:hypothetical protein